MRYQWFWITSILVLGCSPEEQNLRTQNNLSRSGELSVGMVKLSQSLSLEGLALTGETIELTGALGTVAGCPDAAYQVELPLTLSDKTASIEVPQNCVSPALTVTGVLVTAAGLSGSVLLRDGTEKTIHSSAGSWVFDKTTKTIRRSSTTVSGAATVQRSSSEVTSTIAIAAGSSCENASLTVVNKNLVSVRVLGSFPNTSQSNSIENLTFNGIQASASNPGLSEAKWDIAVPTNQAAGQYTYAIQLSWTSATASNQVCKLNASVNVSDETVAAPNALSCTAAPLSTWGPEICAGGPQKNGTLMNYCQVVRELAIIQNLVVPETCDANKCLLVTTSQLDASGAEVVSDATCVAKIGGN